MPVVLIQVDAQDNATAGLQRVSSSLGGLDRAMGGLAGSSERVQAAIRNQEAAVQKLDAAQNTITVRTIRATSAFDAATRAAADYARQQAMITSGVDTSAAALARADRLLATSISTQARAATSSGQLARSYTELAAAQDRVGRAGAGVDRAMTGGVTAGTGGSSAGRGGGGIGDTFIGSLLKYQLGFGALTTVTNQLTDAFTRTLATQRTLAMTQATTGLTPSATAALGAYVQQAAGSGTQPFTSDIIASGLYAAPSAGILDPAGIKAISDWAIKFSAFTGSKDIATASGAMVQTLSEQGIQPSQMAAMAPVIGDVITSVVNRGIVQPNQVAGNISTFGSLAAQFKVPFAEAAGVFTSLSLTAKSSDIGALQTARLISSIGAPTGAQQKAAGELGVSDLLGQAGLKKFTTDFTGYMQELNQATRLNPGADLMGIFGNRLSVAAASGLMGPGGANIARSQANITGMGVKGATDTAATIYNQSPAAQFDNAAAKFKTGVDAFSTALVPFTAGALNLAAGALGKGTQGIGGLQVLGTWFDQHVTGGMKGAIAAGLIGPLAVPVQAAATLAKNAIAGAGYVGQGLGGVTHASAGTYSAEWYQTMGIPLGGANLVGHAPGSVSAALPSASQSLFGGRNSASAAYASAQADAATAAGQARFDAAHTPGGAGRQHIAVNAAQDRLTLALAGFGNVTKALGIYEQAVKEDATISPVRRHLLDLAAEASVGSKAGPAIKAFAAQAPELGGLLAGPGTTALRFGGGRDDQMAEIRKLREQLSTANHTIATLLGEIAVNTKVKEPAAPGKPYRNR